MPLYSPLASPSATIACLQQWGLYTKKSLGQHFLIDDGTVGKIIRLAQLTPAAPIVEVGPGIGTLSLALLGQGAELLSIETDRRLIPCLDQLSRDHPGSFRYLLKDALEASPADLPSRFSLVANLPYGLAATLVLDYFVRFPQMASATVMVQREVAQRIMAASGSREYGAYTVKLSLLAQVQGSFGVARTNFLPPPRVDSTVLRLERLASSPCPELREAAFLVIDAAFAERRKTIRNSLRSSLSERGFDADLADHLLKPAGIDPRRRAEDLSPTEFILLARQFILLP